MHTLTLTQKYAPRTLDEILGQDFPKRYFQAVAAYPEQAYRNYVILGGWGCGKTSLVRAFANDLLQVPDARQTPNYVELDSYQIKSRDIFLSLKDYIFQEVPGYKVVLLDEWHLVDPDVQAGILKDIETCTLPIFFFFASTERNGILPTIFSRSLEFTLSLFTPEQMYVYLDTILEEEGLVFSDAVKQVMVYRSFGHLRDLLNQIELARIMDDVTYVDTAGGTLRAVEAFLTAPSPVTVDSLTKYPYTFVQESMDFYIHERLIKGRELYGDGDISKLFTFYLKYKRYILNEHDFFSFLYLFADFLKTLRRR